MKCVIIAAALVIGLPHSAQCEDNDTRSFQAASFAADARINPNREPTAPSTKEIVAKEVVVTDNTAMAAPVKDITQQPRSESPSVNTQPPSPDRSYFSIFIDTTAAVFGIISVLIASSVVYLAYRGISDYKNLHSTVSADMEKKVTDILNGKINSSYSEQIEPHILKTIQPVVAKAISTAEGSLNNELKKLLEEQTWKDALIDEIEARVIAKTTPKASATKPDEFESQA
jgi:hypothetical protein